MSSQKISFTLLICILAAMVALTSCERRSGLRNYDEVTIKRDEGEMATGSVDQEVLENTPKSSENQSDLSWKTPPEWSEHPASGMRMASFTSADQSPIECSIVGLAGALAGGLKANTARWMEQIHLPQLSDEELQKFLQSQEQWTSEGGFSIQVINFTQLQNNDSDDQPSMIAAIIEVPEKTIFVKMTGLKKAVLKHQKNFKQLCHSLKMPQS